ncbi:MAG: hypothetical protein H7Y17_13580, partial [Chlorobia bacterium]|nr:hypothetical protein [Fimbriimonadaceae bacterium]
MANRSTIGHLPETQKMSSESARRQVLRCILWKASKTRLSIKRDSAAGERLDEIEFEKACLELGINNEPSPLDNSFELLIRLLERTLQRAPDPTKSLYLQYPTLENIKAKSLLDKIEKNDVPKFVLATVHALRWIVFSELRTPTVVEVHACKCMLREMCETMGSRRVPWSAKEFNEFISATLVSRGSEPNFTLGRLHSTIGELLTRNGFVEMLDEASKASLPTIR